MNIGNMRGVWRFHDREKWPPGEWDHEPDKVEWRDEATSLPCIARRGTSGAWCGYVAVSKGHPLYGVGYSQSCTRCEEQDVWCEHSPDYQVQVHGGLTFSAFCAEDDPEHGVCHVPMDGEEEKVWWFGFDCAHCFDMRPGHLWIEAEVRRKNPDLQKKFDELEFNCGGPREVYRNLEYVVNEVTQLARQLAAMNGGKS